ncbi:HNH endonuclease [Nesterenkonia sp. NBAIMH1]|uniref:HNH endonuclease n=1 Tax=Nesterenkonia sp. NBAIMH1 TaxID=2600320 RepID=UPI00352CC937
MRDQQLEREPSGRRCSSTQNLQADHIIEIADDGALTDPGNLQIFCDDCHRVKTLEARAARRQ